MKRRDLLKHLVAEGCELLREGGSHTIFVHRGNKKVSTIPRHTEINELLAKKICKDIEVKLP